MIGKCDISFDQSLREVCCNRLRPRSHDTGTKWNRNEIVTVRPCVHTYRYEKAWNRNANRNDLKP